MPIRCPALISAASPWLILWGALCLGSCSSSVQEEVTVESVSLTLPASVLGIRILLPMGDIILDGSEAQAPEEGSPETGSGAPDPTAARVLSFEGKGFRTAPAEDGLAILRDVPLTLVPDQEPDAEGVLTLRGPQLPDGLDPKAHVVVLQLRMRSPAGVPVDIQLSRGSFDVRHVQSPVKLDTGYGQIHLRHVHGDAVLRTNHGNVTVDHHRGGVDLEIDVGAAMLWIDELGTSTLRAVTREGNVNVRLDPSEVISLDARTELGKVMNTFGVPIESMGEFGAKMVGSNGMHGAAVVLRSGRGHVALEKRARSDG